ncbi:TonB-linked outer membrane protein, SusC/RagA family [Porphyromonadaceae bacterium KH3CP3RA]|nr:TonB-linked outer membrane protein, SusC/RagA family [Porphyromonadaceae bacterium KH3CP3RA]
MKRKLTMFLALFFIGIGLAVAQTQVRGTVVDEAGEPVIGATIQIKGTSQGTVSDIDGNFNLSAPADGTLVISYVGYQTQEVPVSANVRVALQTDTELLDEVIVVAYGTSTKGTFTGSAGVVSTDKIEMRQISNVSNALSGNVAGVQILNNDGQPGTAATVRIRGVGSINAEMDPLYVVDGIPFDGELSSLNPADIASMTVLKDAASTALYGARGANGIIMITTKKGAAGKSTVSVDARYGVNSRSIRNYDVLTSPKNYLETSYQAIYNAGIYNLGYDPIRANRYANQTIVSDGEGGSGYTIYTVPEGQLLIGTNGRLNPNATLGYSDGEYYYTPDNWADETFSNNARQEYNVSIAGGSERGHHYISFGYLNDQGVVSNSAFERYSTRFNGDFQVKEWFKVGANLNYNYSDSQFSDENIATSSSGNAFFIANYIAPIYPIYVRDAENQQIMSIQGRKVYDYGDGNSTNFSRRFMSIANPAGDLVYGKTNYAMDIFNGSWFAEFTPVEGLVLTARYGLNVNNRKYNDLGNAYMGQSASYGGTAYQQLNRYYGFNQQYIANYNYSLDLRNHFDITLGYDEYTYSDQMMFASGQNLYNPESYYVSNAIDNLRGGGTLNEYATRGIISRLNYSHDDKYFGNISYRRDASSRFHPDKRWGNFWSASGAWIMNKESFLESVSWLNLLKFKASFGQQGNDDIGNDYAWLDQFRMTGADGVFADGALRYKGNPDLTWETSTSYNIGFDYAMFNNTLSGSLEYFGRRSGDMLYNKPTAGSLGYTSIPMNIGSMTNSGLEIDLNWNAVKNRNIDWNIYANATFIKNRINELHPDLDGRMIAEDRIYEEGESMYRMYLVEYAGVNPETGLAEYWAEDEDGVRYRTDDHVVAQNYKVGTDDLLPSVYGGFGTSITAFGFDAGIQFAYQLGGQIYDSGYARLMHGGTSSNGGMNWHKDIYNAWTPENTNTDVPRLNANDRYANSTSTRFLTSSNYLSLNNITVGYTVPVQKLTGLGLSKLRIYASADNVGILTSRKGLDPRQSFTSATTARYTPIRSISGGVSLTF